MSKYTISRDDSAEIRGFIKKYEKTSAYRRLEAVMLVGEGMAVREAASITGYHYNSIYELVRKYCTSSLSEFVSEKRGGNHRNNMSVEEEHEIIEKFDKESDEGQVVELSKVRAAYEKKLGREVANSTFYLFIHRNNWRKIKPRSKHPKKANEETIEASKKLTL